MKATRRRGETGKSSRCLRLLLDPVAASFFHGIGKEGKAKMGRVKAVVPLVGAILFIAGCSAPANTNGGGAQPAAANAAANTHGQNTNNTRANSAPESSEDLVLRAGERVEAVPAQFAGTAGSTEQQREVSGVVTLRAVRSGQHANFDRVVFEFDGGQLPGYRIEYIDRPVRQCGSGDAVPLAGDGWLSVRMEPARAHTEEGQATIPLSYRPRRVNHTIIKEIVSTCDFEGQVEWVLGVSSPNHYRVMELSNPARLVVDVRH